MLSLLLYQFIKYLLRFNIWNPLKPSFSETLSLCNSITNIHKSWNAIDTKAFIWGWGGGGAKKKKPQSLHIMKKKIEITIFRQQFSSL
jgi:hypothetical protein